MDKNKLPEEIYAWNYRGSFSTGLSLPVVDMGDTPWAVYTRAQPKYKRVDLDDVRLFSTTSDVVTPEYSRGYREAFDDIKAKYGDLYVEVR